jgi:hypothetical protein
LSRKNVDLYSVYNEVLLAVVEAESGNEEFFISVLAIVTFDMETELLHEPNETIETRAGQCVVDSDEIQILADSMTEVKSEGRPANESESFEALLPGKKLPNAPRFRSKLAGIHGECF